MPFPERQACIRVGHERVHVEGMVRDRMILMTCHARQHVETVLFLGAGASVFAGMPTTKGLVDDVLRQVLHQEKWDSPTAASLARNLVRDHEDKDVEVLYQTIRDMKAAEELHRKAMKHKTDGHRHPQWKREIRTISISSSDTVDKKDETEDIDENIKALESLEAAIRNTLLGRLMVRPDRIREVVGQYDGLFEHVPRNIVTTNYDNVLETYCEQKRLNLVNGFKRSHLGDRRIWEGESGGAWDVGENVLRLVKLHGSITWQKDDDGAVLEIGRPGLRDMDRDIMVAPTLGKKDYGHGIFPALWDRFKDMLSKTELLVVAGFSFRDPRINQMLRSRLKRTAENTNPMKLLHIDLNADGLKELVGADVEWGWVRAKRGTLQHYYRDEMPYVYAHESVFPPRPNELEHVLEILDEVSSRAPPDRD